MVISAPSVLWCAAGALALWPARPAVAARLAALHPAPVPLPAKSKRNARRSRVRPKALVSLALLSAVPLLGPAAAVSAALVFLAVWCQRRASARGKAEIAAAKGMAEAIRMMVAELRRGAPAALAAEAAAADTSGRVALTMKTLAGTARLGGDLPLREPHEQGPDYACLAKAWSLSRRHGLPLADLLDAVRRDISARARFAARTDATMSGPRASAAVLSALPTLGLLLGEAMGAAPLHMLTGTSAGRTLMVVGAAFVLAGVAWSARLTSTGAA
jgi:tight adherence protein B